MDYRQLADVALQLIERAQVHATEENLTAALNVRALLRGIKSGALFVGPPVPGAEDDATQTVKTP